MVFGNGRLPQNLSFSYDNLNLEIVRNFNYLGIIFTRTGNFSLTKKHLADKALKAMLFLNLKESYKILEYFFQNIIVTKATQFTAI
jgi:hypothetical protein